MVIGSITDQSQLQASSIGFARSEQPLGSLRQIHDDEKATTAPAVLHRAVAWFAEHGVWVERVLSDNGPAHVSQLRAQNSYHRTTAHSDSAVGGSPPTMPHMRMHKEQTAEQDRYVFNRHGFGSHNAIAEWARPASRVLDIGCASGYLMTYLHEQKECRPTGIEPYARYAAEARQTGFPVIEADALEGMAELGDGAKFDHVIYADVLEHMEDPLPVLRATKDVLAPGGTVLISLPNIAFVKARWRIARGIWEYEDSGIFDRTHLRFFTMHSARSLVTEAGYRIKREVHVGPLTHRGGRWGLRINRLRPGLLANQIIIEGVPLGSPAGRAES